MSGYRAAIDGTVSTIRRRAGYFRSQIIAVVLIGLLSFVSALVGRSFLPLIGFVLLVPLVGFFFLADAKLVDAWRSELLASWVRRDIDFAAFRDAIRANAALPKGTTEGMLATLPSATDLVAEQRLSTPERQAIAAEVIEACGSRSDALALKAAASGVVAIVLIASVWMRSWMALSGLASILILPVARAWMKHRCSARGE